MKKKKLKVSETSKILADELRRELAKVKNEEMRKETIEKWSSLGFLDGLDMSDERKENIKILYENQCNTLINEHQTPYSGTAWDSISFPIVRRVFSKMYKSNESNELKGGK